MKKLIYFFLFVIAPIVTFADDASVTAVANLNSATIFRPGAELVHTANVQLKKGANSVAIEGLSASVDKASVRITCSNSVTVASFEFSNNYLKNPKDEAAVRKLRDSLKYYERELATVRSSIKTNRELLDLLKVNRAVGGSQSGTSVAELMKMVDYYKSKATELEKEWNALGLKAEKLAEKVDELQQQIDQDSPRNAKVTGKLDLSLLAPIAGSCDITITYNTNAAFWVPYYDIQAVDDKSPLKVTSKAKILQTTGLDWKNVRLSLSTATPTNGQTAPLFETWFIDFINYSYASPASGRMKASTQAISNSVVNEDRAMLNETVVTAYGAVASNDPLYIVNGNSMTAEEFRSIDQGMIKSVTILKDASATAIYGSRARNGAVVVELKSGMDDFVTATENMLDITYDIDIAYSILSTGKEQSVTIRTIEIPATYQYYCAPKLDRSVFLVANVVDWEKYNLLEGEANITFAGTFVGKSYINPSSTKQTLSLTLGIDRRVVVTRELLKDHSSVKFLGSDTRQVFAYRLKVKNTKSTDIELVLKDQYPTSTQKDIVVEVLDTDKGSVNPDTGVVTWTNTIKSGEDRTFNFSYSVKFPKDKKVNL